LFFGDADFTNFNAADLTRVVLLLLAVLRFGFATVASGFAVVALRLTVRFFAVVLRLVVDFLRVAILLMI
jgi:hypothetical protein